MTYFPFDKQKCHISLENWAYDGNKVNLTVMHDHITTENYQENGLWALHKSFVERHDHYLEATGGTAYPEIIFEIFLQRKSTFYTMNIIMPVLLMIILALMVFWLPPESGEKIGLSTTVFLALSVFLIVIADTTPENSDSYPVMSTFITVTMAANTLSLLMTVFVLNLHHNGEHHPLPPGLRIFALKILAPILCMKHQVPKGDRINDTNKNKVDGSHTNINNTTVGVKPQIDVFNNGNTLEKISANLETLIENMQSAADIEYQKDEWKATACIFDRLCFCICLVIMLIITLTLLLQTDPSY